MKISFTDAIHVFARWHLQTFMPILGQLATSSITLYQNRFI
jgi:hypothetical protein